MYILLKTSNNYNYFIHFSQIIVVLLFHFKVRMFCVILELYCFGQLTNSERNEDCYVF